MTGIVQLRYVPKDHLSMHVSRHRRTPGCDAHVESADRAVASGRIGSRDEPRQPGEIPVAPGSSEAEPLKGA